MTEITYTTQTGPILDAYELKIFNDLKNHLHFYLDTFTRYEG